MQTLAAVRCGDDLGRALTPDLEDSVDSAGRKIRPVREDDHGGSGSRWKRTQAAAERRSLAALPVGAVHDSGVGLDVVSSRDDEDVVDRALTDAFEDGAEQDALFGRAEASRRTGGEDDRANYSRAG